MSERDFWVDRLTRRFGSRAAGDAAFGAYEAMGQIAPRLVRRIGITEGNRQTFSLGMTMSQLTYPERHRPLTDLWEAHAPAGERLDVYVEREATGQPHVGETPVDVIRAARTFARTAVHAAESAIDLATRQSEEYRRLADDARALALLAEFYGLRVEAAIEILAYDRERKASRADDRSSRLEPDRLHRAVSLVAESVDRYRALAELTQERYLYANSMRTPQRRVPFPDGLRYGDWTQCLPEYETELASLRSNVDRLVRGEALGPGGATETPTRYRAARGTVLTPTFERFELAEGSDVFAAARCRVWRLAPELAGLAAYRTSRSNPEATTLTVELDEPAHVLIGYFVSDDQQWLQVPNLETNTHADDRGGLEPLLRRAVGIHWYPEINIHAFRYDAGRHELAFGPGDYFVAGIIAQGQPLPRRDAGGDRGDNLDWIFDPPRRAEAAAP